MKTQTAFYLSTAHRSRILAAVFLASIFAISSSADAAATLLGNPYRPPGEHLSIFALQGIDASHMFGDSSFSPQVNTDFEFSGGIGVSYDTGNGHHTDFGIGLYSNAAHQTVSTGLRINFDSLTDAAHTTITLGDFDLSSTSKFFDPKKVEPSILLLGPGGVVYASARPTDIFPDLVFDPGTGKKGKGQTDMWDLNFGALLASLHLPDTLISGYVLYADATGGEKVSSDPYFLISTTVASP